MINDEREFLEWLAKAKHGDREIYHRGLLMDDRRSSVTGKPVLPLDKLATLVMKSSDRGEVHLFQKRTPKGGCEYMVERR